MLSSRRKFSGGGSSGPSAACRELRLPVVGSVNCHHGEYLANSCSYDPEYKDWDFGKISALHETALAQEAGYEYYYMGMCLEQSLLLYRSWVSGFYIHSCIKMRYKATFTPTFMLGELSLTGNATLVDRRFRSRDL